MGLLDIFSFITKPITSVVSGWQDRKTLDAESIVHLNKVRLEHKVALEEATNKAKIARLENEASVVADYDTQAVKNMQSSWKDEYLILLHTLPVYGYVIPSTKLHEGLDRLWEKLGSAGYEWWIVYIGIVASTFGLRWLFNKRVDKILEGKKTN